MHWTETEFSHSSKKSLMRQTLGRTGTEGSVAGVGGTLLSTCSASANHSLSSFLENCIDLAWATVWVYPWTSQLRPGAASLSPDSAAEHSARTTLAAPGEARQQLPQGTYHRVFQLCATFFFRLPLKTLVNFCSTLCLGKLNRSLPLFLDSWSMIFKKFCQRQSAILLSQSSNSSLWVVPFVTCALHQFFAYISFFLYWCFCSF